MRLINVAEFAESNIYKARTQNAKKAFDAGWKAEFMGMPVPHDLKDFLTEVSQAMPNLKFMPYDDNTVEDAYIEDGQHKTVRCQVMTEFIVYTDDAPLEIGRLSFQDNSARRSGKELTYGIYSRKISNPKFSHGRDQHNMVMSKDLKKAVKHAKTYLTPYSTRELAEAFYEPMSDNSQNSLNHAKRQLFDTLDPVRNNNKLIVAELLNLMSQGATFVTREFQEVAKTLKDRVEIYHEQERRQVDALFVRVYNIGEDPYADVQVAYNVRQNSFARKALDNQTMTYKMSELPEDIAHAVASLSILNNKQYVTHVGMKIDERHFWVERG